MWPNGGSKQHYVHDRNLRTEESMVEEIPIWVRGEQRWVSGVSSTTTCQEIIQVLVDDEQSRGRHIAGADQYHITERWRGVEQPLELQSLILDIWNAWGTAQSEVKISLRRIRHERPPSRRAARFRSDSSVWSDRSACWKTVHPKRLHALQNEKHPASTEELLKLVLAQGEVIRRQIRKLRHNEHQIGYLEDKTHKARARKHGSNYLLETYLKSLSEALDPTETTTTACTQMLVDKNSDSGVQTEGDSEQSNKRQSTTADVCPTFERLSASSEESGGKDVKDDDASSSVSETTVREQCELFESISKLNKRLLKQEETLVRLEANVRKMDKEQCSALEFDQLSQSLALLRSDMVKSANEMQHNEFALERTLEKLTCKRHLLDRLQKQLDNEDRENDMLQALMFNSRRQLFRTPPKTPSCYPHQTKELLDTLV